MSIKFCVKCYAVLETNTCGKCGTKHYFKAAIVGGVHWLTHYHGEAPDIPDGTWIDREILHPHGKTLALKGAA